MEESKIICPGCMGDGQETCHNPDHGFIGAMPGEINRLGCPCCGHDEQHKVKNGEQCELCGGDGLVVKGIAVEFCADMDYDFEDIYDL
jgi:hypothetical protein